MNKQFFTSSRFKKVYLPISVGLIFLSFLVIKQYTLLMDFKYHGECTVGTIESAQVGSYGSMFAEFTFQVRGEKCTGKTSGDVDLNSVGENFVVIYIPGNLKTARMLFHYPVSSEKDILSDCSEILASLSIFDI